MPVGSKMAVQPNMDVFTADAAHIGRVKRIRDADFLVDRASARDIYVPFTLVDLVLDSEHRVELTITETEVDRYDWEQPSPV